MYIRKPSIFSSLSFSFERRGSDSRTQNYFDFVQEEHSFICLLQVPGPDGNCNCFILISSSSLCASPCQTLLPTPQELTADLSRGSLVGGLSHEEGKNTKHLNCSPLMNNQGFSGFISHSRNEKSLDFLSLAADEGVKIPELSYCKVRLT